MSQQFCLKWNNHMNNMMDVFKSLLSTESMVDVTLACDGLSLKAHKMVLSACSPFFQSLFLENPCKHPIVILKDMKYTELKAIIEFMYHGEVNVAQDQLSALMKTAETLRVKGLAEVTNEKNSQSNNSSQDEPGHRSVPRTDTPPPPNKRRRGRTRKRSLSDSNRSDDDSNEPKIKQPMSPEIEELSGGDGTMDASNSQFSSMQSQVPMQSTPSHSSNTFHKSSSVISQPQIEEPASADESEFGVEPAKLLEQTLTTDELNARRRSSNIEMQRRSRSSADHSTIVPTSMSSDTSNQQPDSPPDIKPELLELDPPMSPVAGPSHSNDNAMMMYMDQSSTSHPGPSGYQDNTALVPQDSQNQEETTQTIVYIAFEQQEGNSEESRVPTEMSELVAVVKQEGNSEEFRALAEMSEPVAVEEQEGNSEESEVPSEISELVAVEEQEGNSEESKVQSEMSEPGPSTQSNLLAAKKKRKPLKYRCNICHRMFEAMCHLNVHMRTHTGEKPFVCYLCGHSSARLYDLKTHIITHSGKKRYPCHLCPASFNQKNNYERHRKKHIQPAKPKPPKKTRERICEICEESFSSKNALIQHRVSQHDDGKRPFMCDICNKGFIRQYDLKVHLRIHTGEKPYTCKICKVNFRQHGNYRRHLRLHEVKE